LLTKKNEKYNVKKKNKLIKILDEQNFSLKEIANEKTISFKFIEDYY
jgi:hypothetical protein